MDTIENSLSIALTKGVACLGLFALHALGDSGVTMWQNLGFPASFMYPKFVKKSVKPSSNVSLQCSVLFLV